MFSYARRDLLRNPRRTLASLVGVVLGVGLFSGVLFFIDGSGASMTKRAVAPVALDMQRVLTSPLGEGAAARGAPVGRGAAARRRATRVDADRRNEGAAPANEVVVNDELAAAARIRARHDARDGRADPRRRRPEPVRPRARRTIGLNIGTVAPGGDRQAELRRARARRPIPTPAALPLARHDLEPRGPRARARQPPARSCARTTLRDRIARIPGVAAADELAFATSRPARCAPAARREQADRVFGFDGATPSTIRRSGSPPGSFAPGSALLSAEASRALGAGAGDRSS